MQRRQSIARAVIVILGLMWAAACQEKMTPTEVAQAFWSAVQARDVDAVRALVANGAAQGVEPDRILPISGFSLGRTVIDGNRATVDTQVRLAGDHPIDVSIETRLLNEHGVWKVDYAATVASVSDGGQLAGVLAEIRRLGRQFSGEMDRSLDELQRSLPQIEREIRALEEAFRSQIPELHRQLEEFAREMDKALKEPPRQPPAPPSEPIRI